MTYAQVTGATSPTPLTSDDPYSSMSDEEEMRRAGMDISNSQGVGEVLAEVPSEESILNDLQELGLVEE